jgi:hypothetical protein
MRALPATSVTLDGEAVVCDARGVTDFDALRASLALRITGVVGATSILMHPTRAGHIASMLNLDLTCKPAKRVF